MSPRSPLEGNAPIPWTRLFGLTLTDLFTSTGYSVGLEEDLSLKKQLLDAIIVERETVAFLPDPPDGLEDLAPHNLLTFKSHQDTLDDFALDELIGHFVNYRKQRTPWGDPLLPVSDFRLLAVTARFPEKLKAQLPFQSLKPGVFQVRWGVRSIRIIVLNAVEPVPRNAVWELFSAVPERVAEGAAAYHWKRNDLSSILMRLYEHYQLEGIHMAYTVEDYKRELVKEIATTTPPQEILKWISVEERLKGLPAEERLKGLPVEERLKDVSAEERLKGLPVEERLKGLPVEERLKDIPREALLEYLKRLDEH